MDQTGRTAPLLLVLLLLLQCFAAVTVSANPTGGMVSTFDGGSAAPSITVTGGQIDNTSLGIEVPRNVTFDSASFLINAKDEVNSPGQVYIDIGEDGIKEWAYEGAGYGNLGHQNSFFNGNTSADMFSTGSVSSPPLFLPFAASIASAELNASFAPEVNGGLMAVGAVTDYTSGDTDNDTLPEIAVLSRDSSVTGFNAGVLVIDWTAAGLNASSWVQTCAGATEVDLGDFNGDGHEDLVTFAYGADLACVHFTNPNTSALGSAQPLALYTGSIAGAVGDFNLDGHADVVSIHSGGQFVVRTYSDKTSSFGANQTHTLNMNNTATPTTLLWITAGEFNSNNSTFSVIVTDLFGHTTPLGWVNGSGITESPYHFDGIGSQPIAGDIDSDGDIDFIGQNPQGYTIALNIGLQWNTTAVLATNELATASALINASVFDHDGDGVNSLVVPNPSTTDGNAQTMEGNLTVYTLNSTQIGNISSVVQPWSIPANAQPVDMNGDGLMEHVVAAGESTLGLFIGAWHQVAMDVDSDGQDDLEASGYAGHAAYGMTPLYILDPMGNITNTLSPLMNALPYTEDGFGVRLSSLSFAFSNTGNGSFNISGMDIGYDADFIVENNPFSAGNLTNIINQQQTAGTGNFVVALPVHATLNGTFAVSGLVAQYSPGAPNLSLPPTPTVSVTELTSDRVQLEWQDMLDFGEDLIEFEIFRTSVGVPFDLTSAHAVEGNNMTVDGEVVHGETYVYGVRSLHAYGVTSAMSTPLSVTIPYPAPPGAVLGLIAVDTPGDTGGSIDVTWNISIDGAVEYRVYVETQAIEALDGLQAIATLPHSTSNATMMVSTANLGLITIDGDAYYAAVVAFDGYGNATESFASVGPISSLNNSLRSALIEYDLSSTGSSGQDDFSLSALDSLYLNITLSADGTPLSGENLELEIAASGASIKYAGTTDANGIWQAVAVEDLAQLGGTFTTFFDTATMTIEYLGTAGNATMQPVAAETLILEGLGILRSNIDVNDMVLQLDETGVFELELDLEAELATQNTYLEGLTYTWEQRNSSGNITSSGAIEVKGGQLLLSGTANQTDTLTLTSDPSKTWISPSIDPLMFTFTGGPDTGSNQTTDDNGTNDTNTTQEPTFPDATLPGTVDCGTATYPWIDDGTDASITCTITNPNPFDVMLGFSWILYPTTPPPLTFEYVLGEPGTETISATGTTQIEFTPVRNGPSDGLFPGLQGVDYAFFFTCSEYGGQNLCDSMTTPTATVEGEFQWTLGEQPQVDEPIATPPADAKSSTPLIVGSVVGVLLLVAIIGGAIVLRSGQEEEDDWYSAEEEDEESAPAAEKPTESPSRTLGELRSEGRSLDDVEAPEERRPSLFDEFNSNSDSEIESYQPVSESVELSFGEEEGTEEAEEDGISVDENGTEWWEDEEGVWWYREEGWEDWAVWEE